MTIAQMNQLWIMRGYDNQATPSDGTNAMMIRDKGGIMQFAITEHRSGALMAEYDPSINRLWREIESCIHSVHDEDIIREFEDGTRSAKSISEAINKLLDIEFVERGWSPQSPIFADNTALETGKKGRWRLDFAKDDISVEVAFNHSGSIAWNLIKPTLAGELNHVTKAIQTKLGILITATEELKLAGGFDNAIGSYEDYVQYLTALRPILTVPLVIVGLRSPTTFRIEVEQITPNKKVGKVVPL